MKQYERDGKGSCVGCCGVGDCAPLQVTKVTFKGDTSGRMWTVSGKCQVFCMHLGMGIVSLDGMGWEKQRVCSFHRQNDNPTGKLRFAGAGAFWISFGPVGYLCRESESRWARIWRQRRSELRASLSSLWRYEQDCMYAHWQLLTFSVAILSFLQ